MSRGETGHTRLGYRHDVPEADRKDYRDQEHGGYGGQGKGCGTRDEVRHQA